MRVLYLTVKEFDHGNNDGVVKKIHNQMESFRRRGLEVDYTYIIEKTKSVHLVKDGEDMVIGRYKRMSGIFAKKILARFFSDESNCKPYDAVYIRYLSGRADPWFIDILRNLKKNRIDKIFVEIPTYPYEKEAKWWDLSIDRIFRRQLHKYVSYIVTYSLDDTIYGIETIKTKNGILVDGINKVSDKEVKADEIHMIAVARFMIGHGYARIIDGLSEYYRSNPAKKKKIFLHLVGKGPESALYEELVAKYDLQQYVLFHGQRQGKELDECYDMADIALSCFECYKKGLFKVSSLKAREYLAKGLPVVSGCAEDVFEDGAPDFYLEFPNDDSRIDIQVIVTWYEKLMERCDRAKLTEKIRSYAVENIDVSKTMKPVIDRILE